MKILRGMVNVFGNNPSIYWIIGSIGLFFSIARLFLIFKGGVFSEGEERNYQIYEEEGLSDFEREEKVLEDQDRDFRKIIVDLLISLLLLLISAVFFAVGFFV